MSHWRLVAGARWLDHGAPAGKAPNQVMRLTKQETRTGQTILTGGDKHGLAPAQKGLPDRLRWALL